MRSTQIIFILCLFLLLSNTAILNGQRSSSRTSERNPHTAAADPRGKTSSGPSGVPASPLSNPPAATGKPSAPESMFDAIETGLIPVTLVEVHAKPRELDLNEPFHAGGQEILSTAGAYGDAERFLQILPGVISTSDLSNEVLVRGGHPMENLFVIDGIEVPNINHLATPGMTGGFGPMIDSAIMQDITLYTGGYGARYPERLSSVIEIETLDPKNLTTHAEADAGIQGMGGLYEKQFHSSDLLVSAHKGILETMQTAGIGELPKYENELIRFRKQSPSGDRLTILNLGGIDSEQMHPCLHDRFSASTIDSQYSGRRETTGVEWQHVYSTRSFGVANVSDSEQIEHLDQQDQMPDPTRPPAVTGYCPHLQSSVPPVPVYTQRSNEAFSTAGYRFEWSGSHFAFTAGSAFWLQRPHFNIQQPIGAFSPYSVAPTRRDSTSFISNFSTGESGSFAQLTVHPINKLALSAGGRYQTFALRHHSSLTPRLSLRFDPTERVSFHFAYAQYAQLPPYIYLLAFPQNRSMLPMRVTHQIAGIDLSPGFGSQIHIEAYNKTYTAIPTSTEYPSISLHDVVDTIAQQIQQVVWLPMNSGGRGQAAGIEISDVTHIGSRTVMRGSVAYARAMFAGLDHIRRSSNYDLPWIVNFAALQRLGRGYEISARFGYSSGLPYTPFDVPDSLAQNRPIYEVSRMNALRAPYYARFDAQLNKDMMMRGLHLELYMGVNNILNRSNFLSYVWLPDRETSGWPSFSPVYEIDQMPIFPNFGIRYIFR